MPLRPLAVVGLVQAAKVLLGRLAPTRAADDGREPGDDQPWPFG